MSSSNDFIATLRIEGMTCASCELLLERKLGVLQGIRSVDIDHRTGIATLRGDPDNLPSPADIERVIRKEGYGLVGDETSVLETGGSNKWLEIGASLVIIFTLYKVFQAFDLVSLAPSTTAGALSLGGVVLIGLIAGTSSCLAVTGGLLVAVAAKHNRRHGNETSWQKFRPLMQFNVGRLFSYFVLGGAVGLLGQSITFSARVTAVMNLGVALIMLFIALQILQVVPKGSLPFKVPKAISRRITALTENEHPFAPFALGALTFFLPCGFTQSLQLAALASGSFANGAMIMGVFALGTLPSLIGISALSSAVKGNSLRLFLRFSGTLVLLLALYNLNSALALQGVDIGSVVSGVLAPAADNAAPATAPSVRGGVQEVAMRVTPSSFVPNNLTVTAGVPVRWVVDGSKAGGCTSAILVPSLDIFKVLEKGDNVIEFTPAKPGRIAFSCGMGMVRGSFNVL
ncbi:MAG: sulfite exporter TauE/SafE family protein [Candidatus Peribacteraceae bacterium]|nr:sulfite exporter TauE/SafE family protein [Candidatus Peribacteraceae bacterium]